MPAKSLKVKLVFKEYQASPRMISMGEYKAKLLPLAILTVYMAATPVSYIASASDKTVIFVQKYSLSHLFVRSRLQQFKEIEHLLQTNKCS